MSPSATWVIPDPDPAHAVAGDGHRQRVAIRYQNSPARELSSAAVSIGGPGIGSSWWSRSAAQGRARGGQGATGRIPRSTAALRWRCQVFEEGDLVFSRVGAETLPCLGASGQDRELRGRGEGCGRQLACPRDSENASPRVHGDP